MSRVTAYFSHPIRGKKGKTASEEDMKRNCEEAIQVGIWIREKIPELDLYIPGEHEDFVQIAYMEKMLTEKQILDIDCKVLAKKDFLIVLEVDGWCGGGIGVEIAHSEKCGIPIFHLTSTDETTLFLLKQFIIGEILEEKF